MKKSSKNLLVGVGIMAVGLLVGSILKRAANPHIYTSETSIDKVSPTSNNHKAKAYVEKRKRFLKEKTMAAKTIQKGPHIASTTNKESTICVSEIAEPSAAAERSTTIDEE